MCFLTCSAIEALPIALYIDSWIAFAAHLMIRSDLSIYLRIYFQRAPPNAPNTQSLVGGLNLVHVF